MTNIQPEQGSPTPQRVLRALQGGELDRVPVALWRHFRQEEADPEALARSTWAFAQELALDLIKLTPGEFYAIEDWGADVVYSRKPQEAPVLRRPVIKKAEEWRDLLSLEIESGALDREMEAIRQLKTRSRGHIPFLMTIYSPLTIAFKLAGERVIEHLRESPQDLRFGLAIITETTARVARKALANGADGIFFETHLASRARLSQEEHDAFGAHYDLMVLEPIQDDSEITILHMRGPDILFDLVNEYPVHAVGWHSPLRYPSLAEARDLTDKTLMGGLDHELLLAGPPEEIITRAQALIQQVGREKLILSTTRDLIPETPMEHLLALMEALDGDGSQ